MSGVDRVDCIYGIHNNMPKIPNSNNLAEIVNYYKCMYSLILTDRRVDARTFACKHACMSRWVSGLVGGWINVWIKICDVTEQKILN